MSIERWEDNLTQRDLWRFSFLRVAELLSTKKTAYADLKKIRDELRELSVHKANYEELRDLEEREERKEKERGRE